MKQGWISLPMAAILLLLGGCGSIDDKIEKGQYAMAKKQIDKTIATQNLSTLEKIALEEKKDIMHRIEIDFNQ